MMCASIKYGFWAQLSIWPIAARAAVVIGIAWIIICFVLWIVYPGICCLLIEALDIFLKGFYWGAVRCLEKILSGMKYIERAERLNRFSASCEKLSIKLCKQKEKVAKKKKISLVKLFLVYGTIIFLIELPDLLRDKVAEEYLPVFSIVSDWYGNWEYDKLEAAKGYEPLFKKREEPAPETTEVLETTEDVEEETESQILLILSKKGWGGANIRKDASAKSRVITSVSGDVQLIYIAQKNGWINVRLEDGREGWIKGNLVEGVPEE